MRQLFFHTEYGGNWPAMEQSRRELEGLRPSAKEIRRLERYATWKLRKIQNNDKKIDFQLLVEEILSIGHYKRK
jgi:hypothetical protein